MVNILKNNAYHVLGLDISSSDKDIFRRAKEIESRLKINDIPEYDLDINIFKNFRTESNVKDALQKLQTPKKKIEEFFFWFQIVDSIDEKAFDFFKKKDYTKAIEVWLKASETTGTKAFFYKKNLAILFCLILIVEDNKKYLKDSIELWKDMVDSEKFWKSFGKIYTLYNEQSSNEENIKTFKENIRKYLADIYTELSNIHNNPIYFTEFKDSFSVKGDKIEKDVMLPAYNLINSAVQDLEDMKVSQDNVFDKTEQDTIKKLVSKVQEELNKLVDLDLYDDSQTKIMRDRAAKALRTIVLDLHNNLNEFDKSIGLLEVAATLAGTDSLNSKLRDEIDQIKKNKKANEENFVSVDVSSMFKNKQVIFRNNFLQFEDKKMLYKDVVSISFSSIATTTTTIGIPISTSYKYYWTVKSGIDNISLALSASSDNSPQKESWSKLIGATTNLIEPLIVSSMISKIFDLGQIVIIGDVEFSKEGYSYIKKRFFRENVREVVKWTDVVYTPKFDSGSVILWKDNNGKGEIFTTLSMGTSNAVVIVSLVEQCVNRAR